MDDERLDAMFAALADRTRRDIVARLSRGEATVKELAAPYAMSLQAVSSTSGCRAVRPGQPKPVPPDPPLPPGTAGARGGGVLMEESRRAWAERMDRPKPIWTICRQVASLSVDELVDRRVSAPTRTGGRCRPSPRARAVLGVRRGMSTPVDGIVVELYVGGRFETLMVGDHGRHR